MRRVLSTVLGRFGVLGLSLGLVGVSVGVGATAASAEAGKKVCTITDERMTELSGLVATRDGYVVINDGSEDPARERVFLLTDKCKLTDTVAYGGNGPLDPEDLAISPDGKTLWIADIGDNGATRRPTVALWSMPVDGSSAPVIHRLAFPDGKRHDAEALLIGDDNVPLIITKTTGKAEIYRPTGPLKRNNTAGVPLEKAGEITLPKTTTANRFGPAGRQTVTGAARSLDGKRIALRTYADAFEWDVQDGDLVKTLTSGTPRTTPLQDPFGEAIAYSVDGKKFLTVSDVGALDEPTDVTILSYTPATAVAVAADAADDSAKSEKSWTDSLTLNDISYFIAGLGVIGAILVALGIFGIVRARRRPDGGLGAGGVDGDDTGPRAGRKARPGAGGDPSAGRQPGPDERDSDDWGQGSGGYGQGYRSDRPADDFEPAGGRGAASGGGVYGGRPSGGGVYGGQPGPDRAAPVGRPRSSGGGVYGGQPSGRGGRAGQPVVPDGAPPAGRRGGGRAGQPVPGGAPPAGRRGGGGVYGGQPAGGGGVYGGGGQPAPRRPQGGGGRRGPDEQPWAGPGRGGGQYGQPRQRPGGYPEEPDYR